MKSIFKKCAVWFGILIGILSFAEPALAYTGIDLTQETSLTLSYGDPQPIEGARFDLYRVADISERVQYTLSGDFANYQVKLNGLDSDAWRAAAETLAAYAQRDAAPLAGGETNARGLLTFEALDVGLYLVVGQREQIGSAVYTPEPVLVLLPSKDIDDQWSYHPTVFPKYETDVPAPEGVSRKVLKIWDDGAWEQRPKTIEVQLLRNGEVYDTVSLGEDNEWKYVWNDLDQDAVWRVAEKEVPEGYTVSVSQEGMTFVMTNAHKAPPTPEKPTDPTLPQTGMLWWPVPLLICFGLGLFLIGWIYRRQETRDDA